jgi:hypothetical protein
MTKRLGLAKGIKYVQAAAIVENNALPSSFLLHYLLIGSENVPRIEKLKLLSK